MKLTSHEELLTQEYGALGTKARDEYEAAVDLLVVGAKIRALRKASGLTQDQLAERMQVKRAQISKIETDMKDLKLSTVLRVFRALGKEARLVIED